MNTFIPAIPHAQLSDLQGAQKALARQVILHAPEIEAELVVMAYDLRDRAHDAIRGLHPNREKRPPFTLTVRGANGLFSHKIVWIRFSPSKMKFKSNDRESIRFTTEVRGRKNHRYPASIFRVFDDELGGVLLGIEREAAKLRITFAYWRETMKRMQELLNDEA